MYYPKEMEARVQGRHFNFFLGGPNFFKFFNATGLLKNWKKQHFICSNLTFFIVPFFLFSFFSFSLFSFFFLSFFFSFSLGGGGGGGGRRPPQPPSNDASARVSPMQSIEPHKILAPTRTRTRGSPSPHSRVVS